MKPHPLKKSANVILVCSRKLLKELKLQKCNGLDIYPSNSIADGNVWQKIKNHLKKGDNLIFIGTENKERLKELWLETYGDTRNNCTFDTAEFNSLDLQDLPLKKNTCSCAYIMDPNIHEYPLPGTSETTGGFIRANAYHGTDEELRADFIPLIEAKDRYGKRIGYPGVLIKNYAGALVTGNYCGSHWFCFLFDQPQNVMTSGNWRKLIENIHSFSQAGVYISKIKTEYPAYIKDEEVNIQCQVNNKEKEIYCVRVRFEVIDEKGNVLEVIGEVPRAINVNDTLTFEMKWRIPGSLKASYCNIRASLFKENRFQYTHERKPEFVETAECGIVIKRPEILKKGPKISVQDCRIIIDGNDGFITGTHYCGTNDFNSWLWWDFRPWIVRRDLIQLRIDGIKVIRIYIPSILEEVTLRAMDAFIQLCQEMKIVVDICIFSQWPGVLEIDQPEFKEMYEFRTPEDNNILSVSFHNIEFQKKYAEVLAKRYKDVPGIIWNLVNEGALLNPTKKQTAGEEWLDPEFKKLSPPYDAMDLYTQWLNEINNVIKKSDANQPIISTYTYTWANGDSYFTNKIGEIGTYHDYSADLNYAMIEDLTCCNKPLFLEEIGINTQDHHERFERYDSIIHYSLGLKQVGVCSYEFGVSWLEPELPFANNHLKYYSTIESDFNLWSGWIKFWPKESMGLCSYGASFLFGMAYHCTGINTPAGKLFQKFSWIGQSLGYYPVPKSVYLVVPMEFTDHIVPKKGYKRKTDFVEETIRELQALHVDFGMIQEDCIDSVPASAEMIIFPNENDIKSETKLILEKRKKKGKEIYTGNSKDWEQSSNLKLIQISPKNNLRLLVRDIKNGTLYVLHNLSKKRRKVTVQTKAGNNVQLTIKNFGMISEQNGKINLIESNGITVINNNTIIDSGNKRYILQSYDNNKTIHPNGDFTVMPFEPMKIEVHPVKRMKATLLGIDGLHIQKISDPTPVTTKNGKHFWTVTGEMTDYLIHFIKA